MENWKKIQGFNNYSVSDSGNVKRNAHYVLDTIGRNQYKPDKLLSPSIGKDGYKKVVLTNDKTNERKTFRLHRLVAVEFIENPNGLDFVNHIDGIKTNNITSNLEWCTGSENVQHAIRTGLCNTSMAVIQMTSEGKYVNEFRSIREASRITGIDSSCISKVCRGKRSLANGYFWAYNNKILKFPEVKQSVKSITQIINNE